MASAPWRWVDPSRALDGRRACRSIRLAASLLFFALLDSYTSTALDLHPASSSSEWYPSYPADLSPPPGRSFASLAEFWTGQAEWILEVPDTGLPVGESDTVWRGGSEFWSYLHASFPSAGIVDSCGQPVPFPGCVTLWRSTDGGRHFRLERPVCLIPCARCPCDPKRDQVDQQQYPRVFFEGKRAYMVYEWRGAVYLRISPDGLRWSPALRIPGTGWSSPARRCRPEERVGRHPHILSEQEYGECLVGGPPGLFVTGMRLYVFVNLGRSPGHMGCLVGPKALTARGWRRCAANPLLGPEADYGPLELTGAAANRNFEFRTISAADVVQEGSHYYMVYEGIRGPSQPGVGDDQFGLGMARSRGPSIDGPWEKYSGNPLLMDLPGNVGVGHADLVQVGPAVYLYTATPFGTQGRYVLVKKP